MYWFGSGGGGGENLYLRIMSCDRGFLSDKSVDGDELLLLLLLDVCYKMRMVS